MQLLFNMEGGGRVLQGLRWIHFNLDILAILIYIMSDIMEKGKEKLNEY